MVKRGLFILLSILIFTSLASAEIIIHNPPSEASNLGDSFSVISTIKSLKDATGIFYMDLICEGQEINFYKNGVSLSAGEEKRIESSLILSKSLIGEYKGKCVIKGIFGGEYSITNEFLISEHINLFPKKEQLEFNPGNSYLIEGNAIKENGQPANGFISLEIIREDETSPITSFETINNGIFAINVSFPKDMKAGRYLLKLDAYEAEALPELSLETSQKTNTGFTNYNIDVIQIATSLELIVEDQNVDPGTNAKIKAILHDQTGENIESSVTISMKNNKTKLIEQTEKNTNEYLEILIPLNEPPSTWTASAESQGLKIEKTFLIAEKKTLNISLVNDTITIINAGNVFYKDNVTIKIDEEITQLEVSLDIGEIREYKVNAPDGEYEITLIEKEGNEIVHKAFLTGKAISVKEKKSKSFFSLAWLFIILILGIVVYILFRKNRKKTFFGYMPSNLGKKGNPKKEIMPLKKGSKLVYKNPAIVSLSIKGEKQNATTICLNIKNLKEIEKTKNNAEETLQKIINFAEDSRAIVYENQENINFILIPSKTKTFKNELTALKIAEGINKILVHYNRLFKPKIEFGISVNNGNIITKTESGQRTTQFMSLGTFITSAKKMSSLSNGEILFSREINDKLKSSVKAERFNNNENIYFLKETKRHNEDDKKFINKLVDKWKQEKNSE